LWLNSFYPKNHLSDNEKKKMNFSSLSLDSFTLSLIVKQNKTGKIHKEKQETQKAKFL